MKYLVAMLAFALLAGHAAAGPGHDHGPEPAVRPGGGPPRIGMHSERFELVGVLEGDTLVLYLDRYATNEPVPDARIEVVGDVFRGAATAADDGTYRIPATALAQPGEHALVVTVDAAGEPDRLNGTLVIAAPVSREPEHAVTEWLTRWPYGLGALAVLGAVGFVLRRRQGSLA
jgi:hypothetical protein